MKTFKKFALLIGTFLMFSCGTDVVPASKSIPTAPVKTESVKPSLEKVKDGIGKAVTENSKVSEKLNNQKSTISNQKDVIEVALKEAKAIEEKLKLKQAITEAEIISLQNKIEQIKKENAKLLEANAGMSENVRYLMDVLNATRKDANITSGKLDATEGELAVLRDQNKTISNDLDARNKDVEVMQKQVLKSVASEAKA
jgi:chromosome segregation ATPase